MTSDEVAKYPAENPKYDRTKPFYPPDPDLIGKHFAVWIAVDWVSDCATDAEATVRSIINNCFNGTIISSHTRDVHEARKYCHVCMIPTSRLTFGDKRSGPFNLHIKMNPPNKQDWYDRNYSVNSANSFCGETFLQATLFNKNDDGLAEVRAIRQLSADFRRHIDTNSKAYAKLDKEIYDRTTKLRNTCAGYLFDQGSYIETNQREWTLITPFKFPPGYVWDTARALTATFGDNSPLIKRFCELAMPTGPQRPDEWWTSCDDPQSIFIILFSRMLGPERWQYTLACLESTLGKTVDWNATL